MKALGFIFATNTQVTVPLKPIRKKTLEGYSFQYSY